jgi:hypothetical protein
VLRRLAAEPVVISRLYPLTSFDGLPDDLLAREPVGLTCSVKSADGSLAANIDRNNEDTCNKV